MTVAPLTSPAAPLADTRPGAGLQLLMGTTAFAVCFAIFGSVSAMMPLLKKQMSLSPVQASVAIAIPVLLGSLGRIPLGILTDRIGGKRVFIAVMLASAIAAFGMGFVTEYWQLIVCGLFLGISLAVFSVGVGFVSAWYPPQRQGTALGIYGAGNIGQSFAAYGSPLIAAALSPRWGFWSFAFLTIAWVLVFAFVAKDAPRSGPPKSFKSALQPLSQSMSWILSLFYFLTFGGFVAMAIYLPTFLTDTFKLQPADAGLRTAGFVVLATLARPIGGALADRVGGTGILLVTFLATAVFAIFLACPMIVTFTIGALGMAVAIGLGKNAAVFKLVPQYFPKSVGAVTGLVGAAGGLGGFFPPLVLGFIKQLTGAYTLGFILLGLFSVICFVVCWFLRRANAASARLALNPAAS